MGHSHRIGISSWLFCKSNYFKDFKLKLKTFIELLRPFTLIPPLLGILSGSACAYGSIHNPHSYFSLNLFLTLLLGSICASILNGASNIINQVYDVEIDRFNKPSRPIPAGRASLKEAKNISYILYLIALLPMWWIVPPPYDKDFLSRTFAPIYHHSTFFLFLAGLILTFVYSSPTLGRTKQNTYSSNFTIALARGELLKVAGWAMVAPVFYFEPWYLGFIFFLFLLGSTSTKDFSDIEGDRKFHCLTLPVRFGEVKSAKIIAPFFIFPWILFPIGLLIKVDDKPLLTGNPILLISLFLILTLWGIYTVRLILKDPKSLSRSENHPSWKQMYLMMMFAQIGLAIAYIVK